MTLLVGRRVNIAPKSVVATESCTEPKKMHSDDKNERDETHPYGGIRLTHHVPGSSCLTVRKSRPILAVALIGYWEMSGKGGDGRRVRRQIRRGCFSIRPELRERHAPEPIHGERHGPILEKAFPAA